MGGVGGGRENSRRRSQGAVVSDLRPGAAAASRRRASAQRGPHSVPAWRGCRRAAARRAPRRPHPELARAPGCTGGRRGRPPPAGATRPRGRPPPRWLQGAGAGRGGARGGSGGEAPSTPGRMCVGPASGLHPLPRCIAVLAGVAAAAATAAHSAAPPLAAPRCAAPLTRLPHGRPVVDAALEALQGQGAGQAVGDGEDGQDGKQVDAVQLRRAGGRAGGQGARQGCGSRC